MLREYQLTNFKAFGETVTIPIRPLTLIFGANSSGKSSIFQSLLLLKQTLEESKNPETALLPKGSLVDLGRYRDFVHRHETERNFEFGARFALERSPHQFLQEILDRLNAQNARFSIRFSYDKGGSTVATERMAIALGDEKHPAISYFPRRHAEETFTIFDLNSGVKLWREWFEFTKNFLLENLTQGTVEHVVYNKKIYEKPFEDFLKVLKDYQFEDAFNHLKESLLFLTFEYKNFLPYRPKLLKTKKGLTNFADFLVSLANGVDELPDDLKALDWPPTETPLQFFEKSPFRAALFFKELESETKRKIEIGQESPGPLTLSPVTEFATQHLCSNFQNCLENMMYLGPFRSQPERHYTFSGDRADYVGKTGEHLASILFKKPELVQQINDDLKKIGIQYRLEPDELQYKDGSPSNVFSLRLVHTDTDIDASIRDVGFGISQVLPVVMQSRLSEKKTLLIEQPEIHLHPAHQAELGDLFIRAAKEQDNTLLLETHSEHLILRILRRIRETTEKGEPSDNVPPIRPEDVAVLYVQPSEKGAQVIEIPVTEDGDFAEKWPRGFFTERVKELF